MPKDTGRTEADTPTSEDDMPQPDDATERPTYPLQLSGGPLAGMTFTIADWPFRDGPPDVVWLAERLVDGVGEIVGHVPDKEILNAVAAQERAGLPGWTPYERQRARWDPTFKLGATPEGFYPYVWAARMDPGMEEPRHLQAVG